MTDAATFLGGAAAALALVLPVATAVFLKIRKDLRDARAEESQLTEEQRAARVEERREDERRVSDEYRDLYKAMSRAHEKCLAERQKEQRERWQDQRRIARLEAALLAAGIALPPLTEDGSDEMRALREGQT
jgi:hypothetical protein